MGIRPIAICLIVHEQKILVFEGSYPEENRLFYRPLGGGIDMGERAIETAVREFREEIGAELCNVSYIKTIENIFEHHGEMGHEIVFLMGADLVDQSLYEQDEIQAHEDDGSPFIAKWMPIEPFLRGEKVLYPLELVTYLEENRAVWA